MKILVAGIGNVLLGDDGFGVHLAAELARRPLPAGVQVTDFGIRGIDLTYALLGGWDGAILLDAVRRGHAPGTLCVLEPDGAQGGALETHEMHPAKVLAAVRALGGRVPWLRLVGCEPGPIDEDALSTELGPEVAAAVRPAAELVDAMLRDRARVEVGGA